ncbi:MAG: C40 family peptidase, partial [Cyanobacteria bacterium]|nr:C40 family peptidase [Cyanobacteriota bacterium]MDW8203318.1 C40 family peptidase [Cyanobacteriota bacterium SKYGB_h_bin112]
IDLYDSATCDRLATQAASGRHLRFAPLPATTATAEASSLLVFLCEDDYPGWITIDSLQWLKPATTTYQAPSWTASDIQAAIPDVIAFTQAAMAQPNHYRWGGTVAPNYDCSGLMQAAFASVGIRIPRDAYQQEAFTQAVAIAEAQPGDLVFFGNSQKATHVGLYLGSGHYIHSSGLDQGRNGIGIDVLSEEGDPISQAYYRQFRGVGRVVTSYTPTGHPKG